MKINKKNLDFDREIIKFEMKKPRTIKLINSLFSRDYGIWRDKDLSLRQKIEFTILVLIKK